MADTVLILAIAAIGALAGGLTAVRRPLVALGILAVLASVSRLTANTPVGTMRLEQPAIAVVALALLAAGEFRQLARLPRWTYAVAGCLAVYIAVLGLSSILYAPNAAESLRLVAWWVISILGGVVALLLARRIPSAGLEPFGFAAAAKGAVGIAVAIVFLVGGPMADFGIQDAASIQPRVHAFTWEANLYASYLAASVPFGLEMARRRSRFGLVFLALMLVGLPLGGTRGAYFGLAGGVVSYLAVWWSRTRQLKGFAPIAAVAAAALLVGLVGAAVLLPNATERPAAVTAAPTKAPTKAPTPSSPSNQASTGPTGVAPPPGTSRPPYATNTPAPVHTLAPYPDTLAFRLDRIAPALRDLRTSPLIGLGAETYGQRHIMPDRAPDHLAILAVAVLYESGILGALALTAAFALLIFALWRRSGHPPSTGSAAAFLAAIVSFLVSYQATNALHFAQNWLIIGAAVAVAARPLIRDGEPSDRPSP